jgi:membrane protease YdiL (CAAX protease family)
MDLIFEVLDINLDMAQSELKVFIPVVAGLIGFIIFWFTSKSEKLRQVFIKKYGSDKGSANFIISTRYLGGLSLGVIPTAAYFIAFPETSFSAFGLTFINKTLIATLVFSFGLSLIIIPLVWSSAKKPENLINFPQIRAKHWDVKLVVSNLLAWAFYLLGYELFFRGVLLFPLVNSIGIWPAIAINIGLYSATHIPKGLSETIGAIPFAIVLCILTLYTGTIWIAFIVHLVLAWTNSLVALKYNPEMHYG